MAILTVGTGANYEYSTLAAAVAAAKNGDVIQVQAGTYDTNNLPIVATKLTIQGIGGIADFIATAAPSNGRAIIEAQADITLDHVELAGAATTYDATTGLGGNAAGLLQQGGNLTINASEFEGNQDGILAGTDVAGIGSIDIVNSDFGFNGVTSGKYAGFTHNIYIGPTANGNVGQVTLEGDYFHDEEGGGNEVKLSANSTAIIGNVIADGSTGEASYGIDFTNGGSNIVTGNTIEKGQNSPNGSFIHFVDPAGASLSVTNNVFINTETTSIPTLLFAQITGGPLAALNNDSVYSPTLVQTVNPLDGATVTNLTTLTAAPSYSTANPALSAADIDFTAPSGHVLPVAPGANTNLFFGFTFSVPDDGRITLTLSGWKTGTVSYSGSDAAIAVAASQAGTLVVAGAASAIAADLGKGLFTYTPGSAFSADAVTASLAGSAVFLDIGTGGAAAVDTSVTVNAYATGSTTSLPDVSAQLSSAANSALNAAINALAPGGTPLNVVTTANGSTTVPAAAGSLNALVASAVAAGSTVSTPAGYRAAYVIGGAPTTLADNAGSVLLVATTANDTVIGAANDTLVGGNANEELVSESGAETIVGGTGANLIVLNGSSGSVISQGADTIIGSPGSDTVNASGTPIYFAGSGSTDLIASAGAPTVLGSGAETISAGASAPLVFGGAGPLTYLGGSGVGTVVGGQGSAVSITGGSGPLLYFGKGQTTYSPGSANDTVVGYTGSMTATGGSASDLFFGGALGNNLIATGPGSTTIVGGGDGDVLSASGNGLDVLAAAATGSATIDASAATGNVFLFAGGGPNSVIGGSGSTAIVAGSGDDTLAAGGGLTLFEIAPSASASRADVIQNFDPNLDFIALPGYPASTGADAAATQSVVGGNTVISLGDGTSVTFIGVTQISASSFT